jgi:hypothetical protein
MYSWLLKNRKNLLFVSSIALFTTLIFSTFYLKWIHLQHDVGREMYQAFAIATQDKTLYTELTHYFGPFAPYANALFLKLFGASLFNFSLIGLAITIGSGILLYLIANSILKKTNAFLSAILFITLASINNGGGSFFMPYSYSHSYGILLTLFALWLLIKLLRSNKLYIHIILAISLSLLVFTKQEYVIIFIGLNCLYAITIRYLNTENYIQIILSFGLTQIALILSLYPLLFIDYSVFDLWISSHNMFSNHNNGVLHNFLMLYSPTTLKIGLITLAPISLTVTFLLLIRKRSIFIVLILIFSFLITLLNHQLIIEEFSNRAFILNWLSVLFFSYIIIFDFRNLKKWIPTVLILSTSILLYSRQQSASWMWQGLNIVILLYLIESINKQFRLNFLPYVGSVIFISLALLNIPTKLNQGFNSGYIINELNEKLPVKNSWEKPLQKTVDYIENLPQNTTIYTGQESAWLSVFTRSFNDIKNQQWWGYMEDDIISELKKYPPDVIVTIHYEDKATDFTYFTLEKIPVYLNENYRVVRNFSNKDIGVQVWEVE